MNRSIIEAKELLIPSNIPTNKTLQYRAWSDAHSCSSNPAHGKFALYEFGKIKNLSLNTVKPKSVAIFVLFGTASSVIKIISSSESEVNVHLNL